MCLRLRRSMMTESASAVVIGGSPWVLLAGEREEDVVEVGGVHGQLGGVDAVIVEAGEDSAQFWHAAAGGDLERERLLVGPAGPRSASPGPAAPRSASPGPAAPPNDLLGLGQRVRV